MGSINALCLLRIVRKVGFGVVLSFEFETILKVAVSSRFRHDNAAGARLVFVRVFFLISTHQPSLATLSWEGGREGILHWASIDELSSERLLSWSIRSWNSGQWRGNEEEAQLTGVYYCRVLGCKQKGHPRSACNNSWGEHVQYNVLAQYRRAHRKQVDDNFREWNSSILSPERSFGSLLIHLVSSSPW